MKRTDFNIEIPTTVNNMTLFRWFDKYISHLGGEYIIGAFRIVFPSNLERPISIYLRHLYIGRAYFKVVKSSNERDYVIALHFIKESPRLYYKKSFIIPLVDGYFSLKLLHNAIIRNL